MQTRVVKRTEECLLCSPWHCSSRGPRLARAVPGRGAQSLPREPACGEDGTCWLFQHSSSDLAGAASARGAWQCPPPSLSWLSLPGSGTVLHWNAAPRGGGWSQTRTFLQPLHAQVSLLPLQGWPGLFHTHSDLLQLMVVTASLHPCSPGGAGGLGWGIQHGFSRGCTSLCVI